MRKDFQRELLRDIQGYFLFGKQIGINDIKIRIFTFMKDLRRYLFLRLYFSFLQDINLSRYINKKLIP
jgi:hypothetical protein